MQSTPQTQAENAAAAPQGTPVRQLSVFLHNRVGALLALVKLLGDHHIAVLGLSLQDTTELSLLRLIVSNPEDAQLIFIEKGIPHVMTPVTAVELTETDTALPQALAARYLGNSSEEAKELFVQVWRVLRPALTGREAVLPRLWAT